MPWNETTPMDQNTHFIADYLRAELSMTELRLSDESIAFPRERCRRDPICSCFP